MNDTNTERRLRGGLKKLAQGAPTGAEIWRRVQLSDAFERDRVGALHRPHVRKDRRSIVAAAATAAVVVATVVGVNLIQSNPAQDGRGRNIASNPSPAEAPLSSAVEVGRGHVVVSVPPDWVRSAVRCGEAAHDTVIFETSLGRGCAAASSAYSTLTIDSAAGKSSSGIPSRTLDGRAVFVTEPETIDGFTVIGVLVPEEDAHFTIRTRDAGLAAAIAASVRILPDTQVTVPDIYQDASGGQPGLPNAPGPDEVGLRLMQAGLGVQIRFEGAATARRWSALEADAEPGTVVQAGTTVTITYSLGDNTP